MRYSRNSSVADRLCSATTSAAKRKRRKAARFRSPSCPRAHLREGRSLSPLGKATVEFCRNSKQAPPTPGTPIPLSTRMACRGACRCSKNSRAGTTRRCLLPWYVCTSVCRKRRAATATLSPFPRLYLGFLRSASSKGYSGLEWLEVGPLRIPVDENVSALVPYRGAKGSFPYISLADVWLDNVPAEKLKGKIALMGTTAQGLFDLRSTPVAEVYPGVEIHANLIAGMLDGKLKQKPPYMLGAEVILLVLGGVVLSLLIPVLAPLWATVAAVIGVALITLINLGVWSYAGSVLPLAASILMTVTLYTVNMAYGYFVEARSKRQFAELFGQYVPPELVDKMAEDPEKYNMEPHNAELTILFSDVRGFTSISEALSPEHLREYINEYLTEMSTIIRSKYKGTLDKYIGDAIMAFWGAPVEDLGHARNGVFAALEMQRECAILNQKFASRGWPQLKIGIGVNSGGVRVGDMGSRIRRAYTVMGDPVNVASRLEGRTKYYGVSCLVGEATRNLLKDDVAFKEIDKIKVKGKDE